MYLLVLRTSISLNAYYYFVFKCNWVGHIFKICEIHWPFSET